MQQSAFSAHRLPLIYSVDDEGLSASVDSPSSLLN